MAPRKPPPYIQLEALLRFLRGALRQDTVLLRYFDTPDRIVRSTTEFAPVREVTERGTQDRRLVWDTEMPVLAIEENGSVDVEIGSSIGEDVDLRLWYVFRPHVGTIEVPKEAYAQRISKLIWWRIKYWLRQGKFDQLGAPFDLCRDGRIHYINAIRVTRFEDVKNGLVGLLGTLQMLHYQDPFESDDRAVLTKVQVDQYQRQISPVVGPIVKFETAIPPPEAEE